MLSMQRYDVRKGSKFVAKIADNLEKRLFTLYSRTDAGSD
jgi:hypothetical protein